MFIFKKLFGNKEIILPQIAGVSISRTGHADSTITIAGPKSIFGDTIKSIDYYFNILCQELRNLYPYDSISLIELYIKEEKFMGIPIRRSLLNPEEEAAFKTNEEYEGSANMRSFYDRVTSSPETILISRIADLPQHLSKRYKIRKKLILDLLGKEKEQVLALLGGKISKGSIMPIVEGVRSNAGIYFAANGQVFTIIFSNRDKTQKSPELTDDECNRIYSLISQLKLGIANQLIIERLTAQLSGQSARHAELTTQLLIKNTANRNAETGSHLERIAHYVGAMLKVLALDGFSRCTVTDQEKQMILQVGIEGAASAAKLHDIGKNGVPDAILQKPGKFTDEERFIMQEHVRMGRESIGTALENALDSYGKNYYYLAFFGASYHHERFDGQGYPDGIKGTDIPLFGRTTGIADQFDALATKRCYKDKFQLDEIIKILREGSGREFDPQLIDLLFDPKYDLLSEFARIAEKYADPE